jgi:hypothetical protein
MCSNRYSSYLDTAWTAGRPAERVVIKLDYANAVPGGYLSVAVNAAPHTWLSYVGTFAPTLQWDDLWQWPPDAFALANLVLDHTEAYRFVVAPPSSTRWPPFDHWEEEIQLPAQRWRELEDEPPPLVRDCWETLARSRDVPLTDVRSGTAWDVVSALLTLHALADEACATIATARRCGPASPFEAEALRLLESHGSLSRLPSARVRILPKTNFSPRGITIRSLSRYLGLCYEAVDVQWRRVEPTRQADAREYDILILPWPLSVKATDFRPVPADLIANMDRNEFGFFEFAPEGSLDVDVVDSLLAKAGRIDAVLLPECAVDAPSLPALESTLAAHDVGVLIAGVREPRVSTLGRNYLHFGVRTAAGWARYEQAKHHRWCLDERQIRQYHLTRSLDTKKLWWEAIDLHERVLHVVDLGNGITTAPMVCEDLASLDEVADNVRRIGPSLVPALLLDGPQLATRWPCRYASILTDDPGSTVLTLTSYGMASRSRPPGRTRSRVVAHWNSRADGLREIELGRGAAGILLHTTTETTTAWTADGRRHRGLPQLRLAGVRQVRS